jgi:hypothetical protein
MLRTVVFSLILVLAVCLGASGQTVSGPKAVQLTVYNQDFALIRDTRAVSLSKGLNSIEVEDVAGKIDPTSILFKSLTAPNEVAILEQNYQYDLINPDNILNKSTGQTLTLTRYADNGQPYQLRGELLAPPGNGGLVVKTGEGVLLRPSGEILIDKLPEGLHPKPTLNWLLSSDRAGEQQMEISYITNGMGWRADYVVLVNAADSAVDLTGWVTLNNSSGASYDDAKLTLMAGDVRRAPTYGDMLDGKVERFAMAAKPQFEEKSFFEYHMYTMERPTTIRDKETKQLSLLNAAGAPIKKEMIYDGRGNWWRSWWYPGRTGDPGGGYDTSDYHKVNVVLELQNSEKNHMGMPLPMGKVRVYKLDESGSQQFIGEDNIDHTPKDEKVRLYVGDAFDVIGDYKRANYRKISPQTIEETFEVNLRNHKETPVEVKVVDHVWSDWKVMQSSHSYTKKDAQTIEFPVKVPANGETVVTYTIRTTW